MYVVFFIIMAIVAYSGLYWMREKPVVLVLSMICVVLLMLMPMNDGVTYDITHAINQTETGTQAGGAQNVNVIGTNTESIVLFKLNEGYEYTAWIWFHVGLLMLYVLFFFNRTFKAAFM